MAYVDANECDIREVARRLHDVPSGYRQQLVNQINIEAILSAPSWPLVRSLVIDLYGDDIHSHFNDERLAQVEEITLLGGAYGGPDIGPGFMQSLVESPAFGNVRKFSIHSGDVGDETRAIFWQSDFAARLEEIIGVPNFGETPSKPLAAHTISGLYFLPETGDFLAPIHPDVSPHLKSASVSGGWENPDAALEACAERIDWLNRVESLTIQFNNLSEEAIARLDQLPLAKSASIELSSYNWRGAGFPHECSHLDVIQADQQHDPTLTSRVASDFTNALFEFPLLSRLPTSLKKLRVIVPPETAIGDLVAALNPFTNLKELMIAYPLGRSQAEDLARWAASCDLTRLELLLTLSSGGVTSNYKQKLADQYRSDIAESEIIELVADVFSSIPNVSVVGDTLEISRAPHELQHVTLGGSAAADALAAWRPELPIEMLKTTASLSADAFRALEQAKVFCHVHRLYIDECLTDDAMAALTNDASLAGVQMLKISCFHELSAEAFAMLVECPHLSSVRDFSFSTNVENATATFARSPLAQQVVSLGCYQYRESRVIPETQQLPLLRRIDESLTMEIFDDARIARVWLAANPSPPLRTRLAEIVQRTYEVNDPRSTEQIILDLNRFNDHSIDYDTREATLEKDVIALLHRVFAGEPAPPGKLFGELSAQQQHALQALAKIEDGWSGDSLRSPLASYGFDFYEDMFEEFLQGKRTSV